MRIRQIVGLLLWLCAVAPAKTYAVQATAPSSQQIVSTAPASDGDDALSQKYADTTGDPTFDRILRFVWFHAGVLLLVFAVVAGMFFLRGTETSDVALRQEAERMAAGDSMHAPFNTPEGMRSQYTPIKQR
jgi:hypothetical protein